MYTLLFSYKHSRLLHIYIYIRYNKLNINKLEIIDNININNKH